MKDSFNVDFYVASATVIPVLYLALTLQGSTLEDLFKQVRENLAPFNVEWTLKINLRQLAFIAIGLFGASFIIMGLVGDFLAFLALYQRKASSAVEQYVLASIAILLFFVTIGPISRLCITMYHAMFDPNLKGTTEPREPAASTPEDDD